MNKLTSLFLIAFSLAFAPVAHAADTAGDAIFVPVVSRTPGAFDSEWRTDLVISNVSRLPVTAPFTVTFVPNDGSAAETMAGEIGPRTSYTFPDVVAIGFGESVAAGTIMVTSSSANARLTARARIYNVAADNGEFGQHVPGVRVADLVREHRLGGLTGVDGNRTNVGIANPWDVDNSFWISVFAGDGALRFSAGWWILAPGQVLQINDVFAWMGVAPIPNATVEINTARPAYVYASIVRNDSGDPIFIPAISPGNETGGGAIQPACTAPAPLEFSTHPAEGWLVMLQDDSDAGVTAGLLAQKYGFTVAHVIQSLFKGFSSRDVTQAAIAGLRCEPVVKAIYQDGTSAPPPSK